ncbi:Peroxidase 54 [Glycine soja]|uniref:Peroxidase n=2 Tax=Glycine subgen. Soja TaxID=1462606 RepID=A0A0R0GAW6_SOYBN|nr:Peroxidase 54 [Glycine soja]
MNSLRLTLCCVVVVLGALPYFSYAQLDPSFYDSTCSNLSSIGCDASILLNQTDEIDSEQTAFPNDNSIRGLDVVNKIKTRLENACPGIVSCADTLALAAEVSSELACGPVWEVPLRRRDGFSANQTLANENLPAPSLCIDQLISAFANQESLQVICSNGGPESDLTNLDLTTPGTLDSSYYSNLQLQKGLLQSDQELLSANGTDIVAIVNSLTSNQTFFFENFAASMIKMANIGVLTGSDGEIRTQCNFVNGNSSALTTKESSQDGMVRWAKVMLENAGIKGGVNKEFCVCMW